MTPVIIIITALLTACGTDSRDTAATGDGGPAPDAATPMTSDGGSIPHTDAGLDAAVPPCRTLSPAACDEARARCITLRGREGELDGPWNMTFGCIPLGLGCGAAVSCAHDPDNDAGTAYWFPSTCIPDGWTGCGDQ